MTVRDMLSAWREPTVSSLTMRPSIGGRPPHDTAARPLPVRLSALDLWALAVPAVSFIEITIVGRLIISELLMLAMLPWLWGARDRLPLPRWFVVIWAGWLLSQVVTDLVVGTSFADWARGWAAIVFTFTDFAAILVLVSTVRRARLFAIGLAVGGVFGYLFFPSAFAAGDPWKWAFALPVGLALAGGLSGSRGARRRWLTVGAFAAFGVLNLFLGFRSLGGVSLLTAGYLVLSGVSARRRVSSPHAALQAIAGLAFLSLAVVGVVQLYDAAASGGFLGADARVKYEMESGTLGVLIGGRSEVLVSTQAVIDSPILGHGSWAKDFAYVDLLAERASALGYEIGAGPADVGLIPTHSYLMGSWVWAGLLGGLFWLTILGIAVWLLANLHVFAMEFAPLLAFSTMLLTWNVAFSPYGFSARILASYGIALCLVGLRLVRSDQDDYPPAHRSEGASRYPQPSSGGPPVGHGAALSLRLAPDRSASGA